MITIGLSGFSDHPELTDHATLSDYARILPVVEIDTTAYGIRKQSVVAGWRDQVPPTFKFIVKATRLMTGHQQVSAATLVQEFALFADSLAPIIETGQLAAILFQFPAQFAPTAKSARYLAYLRKMLPTLPIAVEFRNSGWLRPQTWASTLEILRDAQLINMAVDEPQTPVNSVPLVPVVTAGDTLYVRLHGRNRAGWLNGVRQERTNYEYSTDELQAILELTCTAAPNVVYIFNNNAGHAAARNALQLQKLAGVEFSGLAPMQLDLFS